MQKIRYILIVMWMLVCTVISAEAQVSIGIGLPNVSIGINLPLYPELVPVPGYPVYYAPQMDANYFFYDGMYWVYQDDNWYASSWYNGPWAFVEPTVVPLFILRVPVRYYRQPPVYFRGWQSNAPPRWGQHWGRGWEQNRRGWDKWNRGSAPTRAPLPVYQRQYTGDRYPHQVEQQNTLRSQSYRYQPRDKAVQQHFKQQADHRAPAAGQPARQVAPPARSPGQNDQRQQQQQQQKQKQQQNDQRQQQQKQQIDQKQQQQKQQNDQRQQQQKQQNDQRQQQQKQQNDQRQQQQKQQNDQRQQQQQQQQQKQPQAPRAQEREQRPQDRGDSQDNQGRGQGQNKDDERGRGRDK